MKNPLKAMASLIKKFKRKRRLSSELHARWGDPSISYPTQGSWNEQDQPSTFYYNSPTGLPQSPYPDGRQRQRYVSLESTQSQESDRSLPKYTPANTTTSSTNYGESVIPKGYFDESIRRRDKSHRSPVRGLGIAGSPHGRDEQKVHNTTMIAKDDEDDTSCDEDDEERDTLGDPRGAIAHRPYATGDAPHMSPRDDCDSYPDCVAKSPPLSVTSRMRRISTQSSMTEHSSVTGPASSRRTSYTAASSVSAPSLPPDTPRYAVHANFEKRPAPRPRYRTEAAPATGIGQALVPSYDELYG